MKAACPPPQSASPQPPITRDSFRRWVARFRPTALSAGVEAALYDRTMAATEFLPEVLAKDRHQAEFTRTIWDYLDDAVTAGRIRRGREMLARHAALLSRIEARFGVAREILVAIWGLESDFGDRRGDTDTLGALATLACDGRRAAFFGHQLVAALKILAGGHVSRADMHGSWAGAMGHTQFMPGTWAQFAVDFDGDGRCDIWNDDPADALASTAALLAHEGWESGLPWGLEVALPEDFDPDPAGEQVSCPIAFWMAAGIALPATPLPPDAEASLILPAGRQGPAFLTFANARAIARYNRARAYVIAAGHLADRLKGGPPIRHPWPRHWRALTPGELREIQQRLADAGFDPGAIDGLAGPDTSAAIAAWQKASGRPADGYPSPEVLAALREN